MKWVIERCFSTTEVVGILVLVMLVLAPYADAQTTVPNTFTSGETAVADEVNANFQALADAIDTIELTPGPEGPQGPTGSTGATGPAGSPDTADEVQDKFFSGTSCIVNDATDIMVKVGPLCVDVYEASVWDSLTGGTQITEALPCSVNGNDCSGANPIFARSIAGVTPRASITWFQAQQACAMSGKRLLTNAEWQMAAAGTPDTGGADDGSTTCNTDNREPGVAATGSRSACVSNWLVYDMVGNLWEWVADWIQDNSDSYSGSTSTATYGSDGIFGIDEAFPEGDYFPAALFRGGYWFGGSLAGVFALVAADGPSFSYSFIGFRCAR